MNNIKIDYKLKRVNLILSNNFYHIESVKKAIEDYRVMGSISFSNKKNILVSIKLKEDKEIEKIGYEFCNYVLALMKNEALV